MLPFDELQQLEAQAGSVNHLADLKPIYDRLEELARQNRADFDLQLAVEDVRQRVIDRGLVLKRERAKSAAPATAAAPPPRVKVVELPPPDLETNTPANKPKDVRRMLGVGAGLGIAAWLLIFVILVQIARNRNMPSPAAGGKAAPGTVAVNITTTPPGAEIRINGEVKCKSNCRLNLAPGNYQVTAALDGFDPGATGVTVVPGNPVNVSLNMVAQTQTVRLFTDLESGRVVLDGKPAGVLQDGQLVLDRVPAGKHAIQVFGPTADVAFAFEGAAGKEPVLTGPVTANQILAVVVTSFGNQANVRSSAPQPVKIALNGQAAGEAGPSGLELKNVPTGDQTLTVGEGAAERKLVVSFGPMPSVTAYLKADINNGTLVVTTNEDDVQVFLNGKEYRRRTRRGQLRIQTVGNVTVRVVKPGYEPVPEQQIEVKKGEETTLAFHLKPLPQQAALQIRNVAPGTEILLDDRVLGRTGPDGSLSTAGLNPGEHAIEARRDGFIPRRILRTAKAGETLAIGGAELALVASTASIRVAVSPADAIVTYRRGDDGPLRTLRETTAKLEPGTYTFAARAPNYTEHSEKVTLSAGESRTVEISLAREVKPAPAAAPAPPAALTSWAGWSREDGEYVRKGGNRVVVRSGSLDGTITFTAHLRKGGNLFRGGKLRWFVGDAEQSSQFEIDKKRFSAKGPGISRSTEHGRDGGGDDRTFTIQVEITPERIVHRMKSGSGWVTLDSEPVTGNKSMFGFIIPGNDEVAISDFSATTR